MRTARVYWSIGVRTSAFQLRMRVSRQKPTIWLHLRLPISRDNINIVKRSQTTTIMMITMQRGAIAARDLLNAEIWRTVPPCWKPVSSFRYRSRAETSTAFDQYEPLSASLPDKFDRRFYYYCERAEEHERRLTGGRTR